MTHVRTHTHTHTHMRLPDIHPRTVGKGTARSPRRTVLLREGALRPTAHPCNRVDGSVTRPSMNSTNTSSLGGFLY